MIKKSAKVGVEQAEPEKFEFELLSEENNVGHDIEEEKEAPDKEDGEERVNTERGLLNNYKIVNDEATKTISKM